MTPPPSLALRRWRPWSWRSERSSRKMRRSGTAVSSSRHQPGWGLPLRVACGIARRPRCVHRHGVHRYDLPVEDVGEGFFGTDGGYAGHSGFSFYGTAQPDGGTGQTLIFDCATPMAAGECAAGSRALARSPCLPRGKRRSYSRGLRGRDVTKGNACRPRKRLWFSVHRARLATRSSRN